MQNKSLSTPDRQPTTIVSAPDGTGLATHEFGNPDGPEILFVHGFCQSHLSFRRQYMSELAERFRIVSFDLRGHGASDKPCEIECYRSDSIWAQDVASVIAAKALRNPVLVGWSMGGRVLREYVLANPKAPIAGINFVSSQVIQDARCRGPAAPKVFPETYSLEAEIEWAITFLENCYGKAPAERDFRIELAYNMRIPDPIRRAIAGWLSDPAKAIDRLRTIGIPIMLSHGRKDQVGPSVCLAASSRDNPGGKDLVV
ncbi:alpha/beta fold hydrolase [Rhizobium sp. HT1-10]|uniref:alpha/beta fold hydrolase n=1 Tax=Rhizobium sp. HT1-10 TaxID=3111638 RepID=UPI003C215C3D